MSCKREVAHLRDQLQQESMSPEDRLAMERLIEAAENGDDVACQQLRQFQFERGVVRFEPVPGPSVILPLLYVCPKDPRHYRIYLHNVDEIPVCPEHNVALVLASEK